MAPRLADLLAGLSRLADLAFGLESGTSLRSCALAVRLARSLDLPEADVRVAFYTSLLHHVGCVGYAHETAHLLGDEIVANRAASRLDSSSPTDVLTVFLPALVRHRPPLERVRVAVAALLHGNQWGDEFTLTACEIARNSARRLGLPEDVQVGLLHAYDPWRGKSGPQAEHGEAIPIGARIARVTGTAALFASLGGPDVAVSAVRQRAGGMLDPRLATSLTEHAAAWLEEVGSTDIRRVVLDGEPRPTVEATDVRSVAMLFGDLADLKSPLLAGHSRAVAALARAAGEQLHLPSDSIRDLELAGLLHDVGRVAVSSAVWEKRGPLSIDEWEQVRLHPYHSERILAGSRELGRLAPLVGRHHERLDGSGYHRGCAASDLSLPARVLAVADTYRTLTEQRPHRPALRPEQAARRLRDAVRGDTLDPEAVHAVLTVAGQGAHEVPRRPVRELSPRELEVLRLVTEGLTNAEIADRLVISRRTAEHHVQHVYTKIGVSSRAAATMFAVEHHLLERDG